MKFYKNRLILIILLLTLLVNFKNDQLYKKLIYYCNNINDFQDNKLFIEIISKVNDKIKENKIDNFNLKKIYHANDLFKILEGSIDAFYYKDSFDINNNKYYIYFFDENNNKKEDGILIIYYKKDIPSDDYAKYKFSNYYYKEGKIKYRIIIHNIGYANPIDDIIFYRK